MLFKTKRIKVFTLCFCMSLSLFVQAQNYQKNYSGNFDLINQSILQDGIHTYIAGSGENGIEQFITLLKLDAAGVIVGEAKVYKSQVDCAAYSICKFENNFLITGYTKNDDGNKDLLLLEFDANLNVVNQSMHNSNRDGDDVGLKVLYDASNDVILVTGYEENLDDNNFEVRRGLVLYFSSVNTLLWSNIMFSDAGTGGAYDDTQLNSRNNFNFIESIVHGRGNKYYIAGGYSQKRAGLGYGKPLVHYPNNHGVFFAKGNFVANQNSSGLNWNKSFFIDDNSIPSITSDPSEEFAIDLLYYTANVPIDDRIYLLVNGSEWHGFAIFEYDLAGNNTGKYVPLPQGTADMMAMGMAFDADNNLVVQAYSPVGQVSDHTYVAYIDRSNLMLSDIYDVTIDMDINYVSTLGANDFNQFNSHINPLLARASHSTILTDGSNTRFLSFKSPGLHYYTGIEVVDIDFTSYLSSNYCGIGVVGQGESTLDEIPLAEKINWEEYDFTNNSYSLDKESLSIVTGNCASLPPPKSVGKKGSNSTLSLDEKKSKSIGLYPNPTMGYNNLNITGLNTEQLTSYTIHNSIGQKVLVGEIKSGSENINLNGLPVGTYTIKLNQGNQLHNMRFLISK